jgi:hypothetical protein
VSPNEHVYIHEFIDIIGHQRANYMHHMTANWNPTAQEPPRNQLCFGVWALLGSTGGWPMTINIWEQRSWDAIAVTFGSEAVGAGAQDPKLEKWWAKASEYRRGGFDRLLMPAPWMRSIEQLVADGVKGDVYAHELIKVRPGAAADFLEAVREQAVPLAARHGWELAGAWTTAMVDDDEAILVWAIPTWHQWATFEKAHFTDDDVRKWRSDARDITTSWHRVAMTDSPLNPMRIGRQPSRDDRTDWVE